MAAEDLHYCEQRAEAEIALAQRADDMPAVQAHYRPASHYLDRIYGRDEPATG